MRKLWSLWWIASHIFVVVAVATMAGLGFWQLRRLDARQAANATVRDVMSQPPVTMGGSSPTTDVSGSGAPTSGVSGSLAEVLPDYTVVTAIGDYLVEEEALIGHRGYLGQPGSWLATPLVLKDGRIVLVVRGWVPRRNIAGIDTRPTAPPSGEVTVTGLAFASVDGGRIATTGADAVPELSRVDLDRFEDISGLEVVDVWIRLLDQYPSQSELPLAVPGPDLSDGPHLSYAVQWFLFAVGAVVVYALILRRSVQCYRRNVSNPGPQREQSG